MGDCSQTPPSPRLRSPSLAASPAAGSVTVPWQGWPCFLVKPNLMLAPMVPLGFTPCHPILPSVLGQPPLQTAAPSQLPSRQLILPSNNFFAGFQRIYTSPWIFPLEPAQDKCLHSLGMQTGPWKLLPLGTPRTKGQPCPALGHSGVTMGLRPPSPGTAPPERDPIPGLLLGAP